MSKRIYQELQDPRKLVAVARKTGIPSDLLKKVAAGRAELSAADQEKVGKALQSR